MRRSELNQLKVAASDRTLYGRAMTHDRPVLGILLMLGFCIVAPMGDAVAKMLSTRVPLGQVVLVRFGVQAALLIPLVFLGGLMWRMRGRILRLTIIRTFLHIIGIAAMFVALRHLPLADAIAIAFVMPFFSLLLGHFVLGEEVGTRRLMACIVGFIGTLLVLQPSFAEAGWPALLPVFVAANFALFMLLGRQVAKETDPIGLQAVSGVIALVMILPVVALGSFTTLPPLQLTMPDTVVWSLLFSIGALGTLAHLLMTWALRYAPSATLAPMQYLEIPAATVVGFIIFSDLPNETATLGILISISAGLYIILHERASAKRLARQAPQPELA